MSRGGEEYVLQRGPLAAAVTEVGGGLRFLRHEGRDLIRAYEREEVRPGFRGALLAPWANRIADGRYTFGGREHQLALSEPGRRTALHGLVCWVRFAVIERGPASVTLCHELVPQPGYPFSLRITAQYRLDEAGLTTTVIARNTGDGLAPYGVAPHPYLVAPLGRVDDWTLRVPASEVLEVTADRLLPGARRPVAGTERDFRRPRRIAGTALDHAFTRLTPDADGRTRVTVHDEAGAGVVCTWDGAALPWLQIHTADLPDAPGESRRGLAVEPMTGPPDAFNSGVDVVILAPEAEHLASWTLSAL